MSNEIHRFRRLTQRDSTNLPTVTRSRLGTASLSRFRFVARVVAGPPGAPSHRRKTDPSAVGPPRRALAGTRPLQSVAFIAKTQSVIISVICGPTLSPLTSHLSTNCPLFPRGAHDKKHIDADNHMRNGYAEQRAILVIEQAPKNIWDDHEQRQNQAFQMQMRCKDNKRCR
jgi:hypothetical protein